MLKYAEKLKVLPILGVNDIAATATASNYFDLKLAQHASILVSFGEITGGAVALTVEASTAASSNATETAIAFKYRLSAAVGTDSMGAITTATTAGISIAAGDDNKVLLIDVNPDALPTTPGADYRFLRLVLTPSSDNTVTDVGATAFLEPRYPGNSIASAT